MSDPKEELLFELVFKMAMAKFLDRFKGEGLAEKVLARPLSHSTTLEENKSMKVSVVDQLDRFNEFYGPHPNN